MAQIAFILLSHRDPAGVIDQARRLTAAGDCISIHFDARAPKAAFETIRSALAGNSNVCFARRRVKCGWGSWSLVRATLEALRAALEAFPRATHFYMVSGDCMPIKSAEFAHDYLDAEDADYIESVDFFDSDWIRTGIREDRLIYRHVFNERSHKRWFYRSLDWQKRLGLKRRIPADLQIMIGSQWWCLRRRTVEWILDFLRQRPDVVRFFRTTWIPDETFFQTLVRHLVPAEEIRSRTLTFLMFTDYGMPVTFCNDHYDMLIAQDYLFARKISPEASELKQRLGALYTETGVTFRISNEGRSLFRFLVGQGRIGRRFAPRVWEAESSIGRERELLIVVAKKWHVGKRLMGRIREVTGIVCMDYLFDDQWCDFPDLGGIQSGIEKRTRHRRALMRMLYDHFETDRLAVAMDPDNMDLLRDFFSDRATTRLLEVESDYSDAWIRGHAIRVGLMGASTPEKTVRRLLPAVRGELRLESERIRDAGFDHVYLLREAGTAAENARALARFLSVSEARALEIARSPDLFNDRDA
ncbi:MAG: glycosyl transferase [Rhodobacterales bacterium]|nr:MAG: glycosyl transferase [Rhodobacterales bacterium]